MNRNLPRNLPGTRGSERGSKPARNLSFRTCPGTLSWFGTCPGTFLEPVVRNVVRKTDPEPSRNLSFRTCPGTFPEPATWKPPRNRPGPYIGKDPIAKAVGEKKTLLCFTGTRRLDMALIRLYIASTADWSLIALKSRDWCFPNRADCDLVGVT